MIVMGLCGNGREEWLFEFENQTVPFQAGVIEDGGFQVHAFAFGCAVR